ncbi:MAG: hypothetical protein QM765_42965 [Myxococcales bacterium]
MGMTKGITANNYLRLVAERSTAAQLEQIKAQLPPGGLATLYGAPIPAAGFVDYGAVMQLLLAADKVLGKGDLAFLREASFKNQDANLNGVYKALLPFASPAFILQQASKLWRRYHDTGRLTAERTGPAGVVVRLLDYKDIPPHHGPEIEGAFEGLLHHAKAKGVTTRHTQCVLDGAPWCEWQVSWLE